MPALGMQVENLNVIDLYTLIRAVRSTEVLVLLLSGANLLMTLSEDPPRRLTRDACCRQRRS